LLLSLAAQLKTAQWKSALGFTFLGALPLFALLLPTYLQFGFQIGHDVRGFATGLNFKNAEDILGTLARFLSIASFEMPRFIAEHTKERIAYLLNSPLLLLPGFFLWAVGYFQPLGMILLWFVKKHPRPDWISVKYLGLGAFLLIYGCFLFSPDMAASFRIVLFFPLILLYSLYCYDYLRTHLFWRRLGLVFIGSVVIFQLGYTLKNIQSHQSVYAQNRDLMAQAIDQKDYRILSQRRPGSLY